MLSFFRRPVVARLSLAVLGLVLSPLALAHGIPQGDAAYVQAISGAHPGPFTYLGAKHMVTGYDHLLFLFAVIFYLYRLSHIALYVSLFALGHSVTLLLGVYVDLKVNPYLVDALIGLSVVYKALDNLRLLGPVLGRVPDSRYATLVFGLLHGFGLATRVQEYQIASDGLLVNLLAFNGGVELGQLLALSALVLILELWRRRPGFTDESRQANQLLLVAGAVLTGYQLVLFWQDTGGQV